MVTILLLFLGQSLWKFPRFSMQKWLPHEERQKKKNQWVQGKNRWWCCRFCFDDAHSWYQILVSWPDCSDCWLMLAREQWEIHRYMQMLLKPKHSSVKNHNFTGPITVLTCYKVSLNWKFPGFSLWTGTQVELGEKKKSVSMRQKGAGACIACIAGRISFGVWSGALFWHWRQEKGGYTSKFVLPPTILG